MNLAPAVQGPCSDWGATRQGENRTGNVSEPSKGQSVIVDHVWTIIALIG